MLMRVCYLDSHEAGLCLYLVIHIKTYYFRLCHIHWRSLALNEQRLSILQRGKWEVFQTTW
jgi:hypothetical protein